MTNERKNSNLLGPIDAAVNIIDAVHGWHSIVSLLAVPQEVVLTDGEQSSYNAAIGFSEPTKNDQ